MTEVPTGERAQAERAELAAVRAQAEAQQAEAFARRCWEAVDEAGAKA